MKASVEIKVKVDGVSYLVKAGEVIPAVLAEYWASCKCVEQMKRDGIISEIGPASIPSASVEGKTMNTVGVKK